MRALLEFAPLLAFAIAYYLRDLYFATAVLIATTLALVALEFLLTRRVTKMHLLGAALVLVFGSATLVLHNARFIQWKPTILLWILAIAFAVSSFVGKEPLIQRILQPALGDLRLARDRWQRLNWLWVGFYALLGAANILVALNAPERVWVSFKVFGITAATVVFLVAQAAWVNARASE